MQCFKHNIEQIEFGKKGILISYYKKGPNNPKKLIKNILSSQDSKFKIRTDQKVFYDFEGIMNEDRFDLVKKVIKLIS